MPIKFRCQHCRQFLGISPSRAGELTDCPTCGRTVRIPNLDGTITPLPTAKIDLRDEQLAEALTALSRIGSNPEESSAPASARSAAASVATPVAPVSRRSPPTVIAEPLAPPQDPDPVVMFPGPGPAAPVARPVPELLFDEQPPDVAPALRSVRRRPQSSPELKIVVLALAVLAVFIAGFFTGRLTGQPAATSPAPVEQHAPATGEPSASPSPPAAAAPKNGLYGRVTCQTAAGPLRPDGGARVLALPVERPEGLPLETSAFRAGAVPTDRARATDALRALGGDYALADPNGDYALNVAAGKYDLLFLSRHHSRDPEAQLPEETAKLLAAWFDQPAGLVGSIAVRHSPIDFNGTSLAADWKFAP